MECLQTYSSAAGIFADRDLLDQKLGDDQIINVMINKRASIPVYQITLPKGNQPQRSKRIEYKNSEEYLRGNDYAKFFLGSNHQKSSVEVMYSVALGCRTISLRRSYSSS